MSGAIVTAELRDYREGDLEEICRLDEACFTAPFRVRRETMLSFVTQKGTVALVAETGEEIVGLVIVHLEGMGKALGGYVVTLDVAESWRRKGLASRLMREAEGRLQEKGALWMGLHVFVENAGAILLYERSGYVQGEREAGFYGVGMDAWVFRKWLGT